MVIVKLVVMFERPGGVTRRPSGDSGGIGSTKRSPDHD